MQLILLDPLLYNWNKVSFVQHLEYILRSVYGHVDSDAVVSFASVACFPVQKELFIVQAARSSTQDLLSYSCLAPEHPQSAYEYVVVVTWPH